MPGARPVVFIVNPISGPRRQGPRWRARTLSACVEALRSRGHEPIIRSTEGPGHGEELARDAARRGGARVVAWGGDGTVNEVARGLIATDAELGIVPVGSGNGLARAVGLPLDPVDAAVLAADGQAFPLDAGRLEGRWFFNVAGIGFDARVARVFNAAGPASRGFLSYVRVTLRELWDDRGTTYRISVDGQSREMTALMITVANSCEYGNGARIAPDALVDDGWLDVVAVGASGPLANLWRARRLFDGTVARDRHVWTARARRIELRHDGGMLYHVDGDAYEAGDRLVIEIVPGALRFVRPRASRSGIQPGRSVSAAGRAGETP